MIKKKSNILFEYTFFCTYLIFWKENVDHITLLQFNFSTFQSWLPWQDSISFFLFLFFSYNFLKDACCFCCWLVVRRLWSISNGSLTKEWDWHEIVLLAPIFPQSLLNTKISIVLHIRSEYSIELQFYSSGQSISGTKYSSTFQIEDWGRSSKYIED